MKPHGSRPLAGPRSSSTDGRKWPRRFWRCIVRLPRRVTYCLILAVNLVAVLYRYPLELGHEVGSDTTFIHSLAGSLSDRGYAAWILHPLSYFGLYALSYPSAMPFLFGSLAEAGGIPVEGAILLSGLVFSIAGGLSAFAASRSIREDDRLALIVALLFSIAPFYLKDTTWVGSGRGFVTALVPAVFFLLLRNMKTRDVRFLFLSALLVILLSAIHRMGILAIFPLIAFGFAIPFHRLTQKLRFALGRYESRFRWASAGTALSGFFLLFYIQFLFPGIAGADVVQQYGTGRCSRVLRSPCSSRTWWSVSWARWDCCYHCSSSGSCA